jgi:putative transposase
MSRLRRLLISDKIFFITCNFLPNRLPFTAADFVCLADAIRGVRTRRKFLLTGYVFMPDHWHALIAPDYGDTLPNMMDAVKVAGMRRVNARRSQGGSLWQPRYYDEIIWTVKQYTETLDYMHFNPVRRSLVLKPDDWAWSSLRFYGSRGEIPLEVDRLSLPANQNTRLG